MLLIRVRVLLYFSLLLPSFSAFAAPFTFSQDQDLYDGFWKAAPYYQLKRMYRGWSKGFGSKVTTRDIAYFSVRKGLENLLLELRATDNKTALVLEDKITSLAYVFFRGDRELNQKIAVYFEAKTVLKLRYEGILASHIENASLQDAPGLFMDVISDIKVRYPVHCETFVQILPGIMARYYQSRQIDPNAVTSLIQASLARKDYLPSMMNYDRFSSPGLLDSESELLREKELNGNKVLFVQGKEYSPCYSSGETDEEFHEKLRLELKEIEERKNSNRVSALTRSAPTKIQIHSEKDQVSSIFFPTDSLSSENNESEATGREEVSAASTPFKKLPPLHRKRKEAPQSERSKRVRTSTGFRTSTYDSQIEEKSENSAASST